MASLIISITSVLIALSGVYIAWRIEKVARAELEQTAYQQMFSTYNLSSQATMVNPQFLYSVHELDKNIPVKEAQNISYLGLLIDCFQRFYHWEFDGDFKKMEEELINSPTFFSNLLAVKRNQERWETMKKLFYNNNDKAFTDAVDALIKNANK